MQNPSATPVPYAIVIIYLITYNVWITCTTYSILHYCKTLLGQISLVHHYCIALFDPESVLFSTASTTCMLMTELRMNAQIAKLDQSIRAKTRVTFLHNMVSVLDFLIIPPKDRHQEDCTNLC